MMAEAIQDDVYTWGLTFKAAVRETHDIRYAHYEQERWKFLFQMDRGSNRMGTLTTEVQSHIFPIRSESTYEGWGWGRGKKASTSGLSTKSHSQVHVRAPGGNSKTIDLEVFTTPKVKHTGSHSTTNGEVRGIYKMCISTNVQICILTV